MSKLNHIQAIRFSEKEINRLLELKHNGMNISKFIRLAVKDRLDTHFQEVKKKEPKTKMPF